MNCLPAPELRKILLLPYKPCEGFDGTCKGIAKWDPKLGHVPRGFTGAIGSLDEVAVVIVVAEPGDPHNSESFDPKISPSIMLEKTSRNTYKHFSERTDLFHKNLRYLVDLIFPNMQFDQQLRKIWLTESYLCSAPKEGRNVPAKAEKGCAERYLAKQLRLLGGRPIVALGNKAQTRIKRLMLQMPDLKCRLIEAWSVAPPGANNPKARPSWESAAKKVQLIIRERENK